MDIERIIDGVETLLHSEPAGTKIEVWADGSITRRSAVADSHGEAGADRPLLVTERGRHTRRRIEERLRDLQAVAGR